MDTIPASTNVGAIYADEKPSRRAVSISSVDTEPIVRAASTQSAVSSTSNNGDAKPRRAWFAHESDDVPLDDDVIADAALVLPLEQISEAPVAVVNATSLSSCSCVAEALPETLTMDVGTRLCLSDGTLIGYICSVLGPVKQAFYVVKVARQDFGELLTAQRLAEGASLHYDLLHQEIMYDPFEQCDAAKGTDASYINDDELPGHVRPDFSDDEKEMEWKRQKRSRCNVDDASISSDEPHEDIEWSKMQLDDEAVVSGAFDVVAPQWVRGANPGAAV